MEDRELIQVNVQLPVEALHQFTMLIEQLRRLSEAAGGGPEHAASPAREQAESAVFDPERFQLLSRELKPPESARPPQSAAQEEAPAVRRAVQREVPPPESAGAPVSAAAPEPRAMYPDTAEAGHAGAEAVRLAEAMVRQYSQSMYVEAAARNEAAIRLYRRLGYDCLNSVTLRKDFPGYDYDVVRTEQVYGERFEIRKDKE